MRRLKIFANSVVEPNCVVVRRAVAEAHGLRENERVFVCAYQSPKSRVLLKSWIAGADDEVGPDGCLVAPDLLKDLEKRIPGLAADRLVILRSGKPALPVFYALTWTFEQPSPAPGPEDVVFLLDVSSSMEGTPLRRAKWALRSFVEQKRELGLSDRLGLVTFGGTGDDPEDVEVVCDPRQPDPEHRAFLEGLWAVQAGGVTPMAGALRRGRDLVAELDADDSRRSRVVLVTDGHPYPGAVEEIRELATEMAQAKIPVATVGVGREFDRSLLAYLAARTGAPFLEAHSIRQLPHLLAALANA